MLILSANYAVHLFCDLRLTDPNAAILMNLSTYFLSYWLFSTAFMILLDRFYLSWRRTAVHLSLWTFYTVATGVVLFLFPEGVARKTGTVILAILLLVYGVILSLRILKTYRRALRIFDESSSDYVAAYIRWLSVLTYWAMIFGVSCSILTFMPDRYVFIWVLSSIPFYIYLFVSYMNYMLFYERVEKVLEAEVPSPSTIFDLSQEEAEAPLYFSDISKNWSLG